MSGTKGKSGVYIRTVPPWNKGLTKETDKRIMEKSKNQTGILLSDKRRDSMRGPRPHTRDENNHNWKNSKEKGPIHGWVEVRKGKPKKCEVCGENNKNKIYDWANIDHKYRRKLSDYIRMCRPCHRKYDYGRRKSINN